MEEKPKSIDSPGSRDAQPSPNFASSYIKPQGRKPHDPDVLFEEYYYYAQRTREEETTFEPPSTVWWHTILKKKESTVEVEPTGDSPHALTAADFAKRENRLEITDEEWTNASRALRTASWGACE
jgi:hypothetical protein